jgi:hypothetical protein
MGDLESLGADMPEANDPSGVSADYTPQSEAAEYVRPPSAGDFAQFELFYNDPGNAFWSDEILSNDDIDVFFALVRQDAPYSTAVVSGPDYSPGTGRPTIAEAGLYALHLGVVITGFHDSDVYTLKASTGDSMMFDSALASQRKLLSYNGSRVELSVDLTAYLDASYADGSTHWLNTKLFRHTGGAATPVLDSVTFHVTKIGD